MAGSASANSPGAGEDKLTLTGLKSAGVKMTPAGNKEVSPAWPEPGVNKSGYRSPVGPGSALAKPLPYVSTGKLSFHPKPSLSVLSSKI